MEYSIIPIVKKRLSEQRMPILWQWDSVHASPPSQLFHYTTANGLAGILCKRAPAIHATHVAHLNDPTEVLYAEQLILEQFRFRRAQCKDGSLTAMVYDELSALLPTLIQTQDMYVASFSAEGDSLSQWQSYAGKGRGYSIGFSGPTLLTLYRRARKSVLLRKVLYRREEQIGQIRRLLASIDNITANYVVRLHSQEVTAKYIAEYLGRPFEELLVSFKDGAFESEREWRVCVFKRPEIEDPEQLPDVDYRVSNDRLIPFIPIPLNDDMSLAERLACVNLGPALDKKVDKQALQSFLASRGLPDVAKESGFQLR